MAKGITFVPAAHAVRMRIGEKSYFLGKYADESEAQKVYERADYARNVLYKQLHEQFEAFMAGKNPSLVINPPQQAPVVKQEPIVEQAPEQSPEQAPVPDQTRSFAPKARKRPRPNDNVVSVDSPVSVASTQPVSQDGMEDIPTGGICEDEVIENPLYTLDTYTTTAPPPPPVSINKIIPPHIPAVSVPIPAKSTTVKAPDPVNRPVDAIVVKGRQNTFEFNGRTYDLRDCEMSPSPTGEEDTYYVYDDRDDPVCYVRIVA